MKVIPDLTELFLASFFSRILSSCEVSRNFPFSGHSRDSLQSHYYQMRIFVPYKIGALVVEGRLCSVKLVGQQRRVPLTFIGVIA